MLELNNGVSYDKKLLVDPTRRVDSGLVCVTHAHKDHVRPHTAKVITSDETAKLADFIAITEDVEADGMKITMHDAGHCIGSRQFCVEENDKRTVFTGDFSMEDTVLPAADVIDCDELVIESTFGLPDFEFEKYESVAKEVAQWAKANHDAGRIVVLGGYALGKAQELTKIVCDEGITPLVHEKVLSVNDLCQESGVRLGDYVAMNNGEAEEMMRDAFVAIVPFNLVSHRLLHGLRMQHRKKIVSGVATGWAKTFSFVKSKGVDRAFQMSGHADFPGLCEYVEGCGAKKIFTIHGYANEFARQLRKKGFDAQALKSAKGQQKLGSF